MDEKRIMTIALVVFLMSVVFILGFGYYFITTI